MKIGDLVSYRNATRGMVAADHPGGTTKVNEKGIIVEIMSTSHPKQWPKVKVLTKEGLEEWITQYCEVVSK